MKKQNIQSDLRIVVLVGASMIFVGVILKKAYFQWKYPVFNESHFVAGELGKYSDWENR